jgi:hypothetical protein
VSKALQEFEAQVLEAEALWGATIREQGDALRGCARDLYLAFETIVENAASGGRDFESDREFARRIRSDASSASKKDNRLSTAIDAAVTALEGSLRGHLKRS